MERLITLALTEILDYVETPCCGDPEVRSSHAQQTLNERAKSRRTKHSSTGTDWRRPGRHGEGAQAPKAPDAVIHA